MCANLLVNSNRWWKHNITCGNNTKTMIYKNIQLNLTNAIRAWRVGRKVGGLNAHRNCGLNGRDDYGCN